MEEYIKLSPHGKIKGINPIGVFGYDLSISINPEESWSPENVFWFIKIDNHYILKGRFLGNGEQTKDFGVEHNVNIANKRIYDKALNIIEKKYGGFNDEELKELRKISLHKEICDLIIPDLKV